MCHVGMTSGDVTWPASLTDGGYIRFGVYKASDVQSALTLHPNMSTTRQRQTGTPNGERHSENLPPKREGKATQDVKAPLSGTSLSTVSE